MALLLTRGEIGDANFELIDVRERGEHDLVAIPGSRLITLDRIVSGEVLSELPRDRDLVLYCKAGTRSAIALAELRSQGYTRMKHLSGGVLAWLHETESMRHQY